MLETVFDDMDSDEPLEDFEASVAVTGSAIGTAFGLFLGGFLKGRRFETPWRLRDVSGRSVIAYVGFWYVLMGVIYSFYAERTKPRVEAEMDGQSTQAEA
jgi:hypothetical protein